MKRHLKFLLVVLICLIGIFVRVNQDRLSTGDKEPTSVLENVWIQKRDDFTIQLYQNGVFKDYQGDFAQVFLEETGCLADVILSENTIYKIRLKNEKIKGKLLVKSDTEIEIEGYGKLPLAEGFRIYQLYDTPKEVALERIPIGYDVTEFIVAEGQVCGGIITKKEEQNRIRVLLKNRETKEAFYDQVSLKGTKNYKVTYGARESIHSAKEELSISADSEYWVDNRIKISPLEEDGELIVTSLTRSYGTPSYLGTIELEKREDGILIVNELGIEEYLYSVVSSEMPSSYPMEALKAQAVCARSYAYRQLEHQGEAEFGAHVDDTTGYQVYNNGAKTERTIQAVNETQNLVLIYNDQLAETYYFSTSCGYTTDERVWGGEKKEEYGYLQPCFVGTVSKNLDLVQEEKFQEFIQTKDEDAYESREPWYRWEAEFKLDAIEKAYPQLGNIQSVEVEERLLGGCMNLLLIKGEEGEKRILGQYAIRDFLGDYVLTILRQDNSEITCNGVLPSAFFYLSPTKEDSQLIGYQIYGGGYGHGVGMSQNGARDMAEEGMKFKEILKHFYTGTQIKEKG